MRVRGVYLVGTTAWASLAPPGVLPSPNEPSHPISDGQEGLACVMGSLPSVDDKLIHKKRCVLKKEPKRKETLVYIVVEGP